jgi:hypothetical protein
MEEELRAIDFDQWQLLLHILSAPNKRRDKKVIYKKWLGSLFSNDMHKYVITDSRYMYLTQEGRDCLSQITWGKRKIEFTWEQQARAVKAGILVRGNQGYQFRNWLRVADKRTAF